MIRTAPFQRIIAHRALKAIESALQIVLKGSG